MVLNTLASGPDDEHNTGTGFTTDAIGTDASSVEEIKKEDRDSVSNHSSPVLPRTGIIRDICSLSLVLLRIAWRHKIISAAVLLFLLSFLPSPQKQVSKETIKSHPETAVVEQQKERQRKEVQSVFDEPTQSQQYLNVDNEQRIQSAERYLISSIEPDGRFRYEVDPHSGQVSEVYTMSRHCDALWSMVKRYNQKPTNVLNEAITKSLAYVSLNTKEVASGQTAVFDNSETSAKLTPPSASLGANAFAILAINDLGDDTHNAKLQSLAMFILKNQQEDGSYSSRYVLHVDKHEQEPLISYHQYAATQAMVRMYERTKDKQYMASALKALTFLVKDDRTKGDYHYVLLIDQMKNYVKYTKNPELHYWNAVNILNSAYRDMQLANSERSYVMSLAIQLKVARIGYEYIKPEHREYYPEMTERVKMVVDALGKMQIGGKYSGAFIRGGRRSDRMQLRVGETQRAMTALMTLKSESPERLAEVPE